MAFYVYEGRSQRDNSLVYIGTTTQKPEDRFRWHRNNGKNLSFKIIRECNTAEEMLNLEFEMITKYEPKMNKIKSRKQNLNVALSNEDLKKRIGDKNWCQSCLKRHVDKGFDKCYFCSRKK